MIIKKLVAWYKTHQRRLPWRETRNPYRIFISELMLQQTQVDRVIPKYATWIKRFPSWTSLAATKTSDLIRAWAGLGYNRRALYAREAARAVVTDGIPKDEAGWRRLKGVGPYMAAALTEFANRKRAIVVDTNVRRVVGRAFLGLTYPRPKDDARIIRALEKVTPSGGAHWEVPQAFMDLASAVCLPRIPNCDACPLKNVCTARPRFTPDRIALTLKKKRTTKPVEARHREKKYPDRIYRGRILAWIRVHGPTDVVVLGPRVDDAFDPIADQEWIRAMAKRLVKDGLCALHNGRTLSLPRA